MNRRDSIKYIATGTLASGLLLTGCDWAEKEEAVVKSLWKYKYGRTPKEIEYDDHLLSQQFFSQEEMAMIIQLGHFILPANEVGDIEKAEVPDFIEFMAKDFPDFQEPLKGGLTALNQRALSEFNLSFVKTEKKQKQQLIDPIAYPDTVTEEFLQQSEFFTLIRNLVVTGYFTSEVGVKDLGYQGNQPNVWDGVPNDILDEHQMEYDPKWTAHFLDIEKRNDVAQWDDQGNLIR